MNIEGKGVVLTKLNVSTLQFHNWPRMREYCHETVIANTQPTRHTRWSTQSAYRCRQRADATWAPSSRPRGDDGTKLCFLVCRNR